MDAQTYTEMTMWELVEEARRLTSCLRTATPRDRELFVDGELAAIIDELDRRERPLIYRTWINTGSWGPC